MTPGPFERTGEFPRMTSLSRLARHEAGRAVIAYLAAEGCLGGSVDWDSLSAEDRETWVKAVTEVFDGAQKAATKAGLAELAVYEEIAVALLFCRKCGSAEEEPCRDLRLNVIRYNKHPHDERMSDLEAMQ